MHLERQEATECGIIERVLEKQEREARTSAAQCIVSSNASYCTWVRDNGIIEREREARTSASHLGLIDVGECESLNPMTKVECLLVSITPSSRSTFRSAASHGHERWSSRACPFKTILQ